MDEEIPIVLLCQLNRNCETRGTYSFRHQLSDLRDSGSIEQDADTVAFISRLSVVNIHEDPDTHLPTRGGARSCWPRTAKASWDTCASCTTRA